MGTPQVGMDSVGLAQYLLDIQLRSTKQKLLKQLKRTSEPLRRQVEQYAAIQDRFVTRVFYEMCRTPLPGSSGKMVSPLLLLVLNLSVD